MTDTIQAPETLFASHGAALRRLAARLLDDDAAIDDALQEVWVRTLESPPRRWDRTRSWLEAVLRNVVRRQARQRRRRLARESRSARAERTAATVDVVARQQTLQALTSAVLALDPAAQQLVFLRYFDGLAPRVIATRTDQPIESVYRGLERARRELRRRLGEKDHDWRAGLAALCGIPRGRDATVILTTGMLLMAFKKHSVFVLGCGLVALLCAIAWQWDADPVGPTTASTASPIVAALDRPLEQPSERSELDTSTSGPRTLGHFEYSMEVRVVDRDDLPATKAEVWVAPALHDLNRGATDADGALRLRWRGRTRAMTMVVGAPEDAIAAGRVRRVDVESEVHTVVMLRIARSSSGYNELKVRYKHRLKRLQFGPDIPDFETHDGVATFVTRTGASDPGWKQAATVAKLAYEAEVLQLKSARLELETRRRDAGGGRIHGRVIDARDEPVPGALVVAGLAEDRHSSWQTRTRENGTFELKHLPAGDYHLRAGGGDHGLARYRLGVARDGSHRWDAQLDRGAEVRGQLLDSSGIPLAGWRVEIAPEDGSAWADGAVADDTGHFAIPNVELRSYRLRAFAPRSAFAAWQTLSVRPSAESTIHTLPEDASATGKCKIVPRVPGHRNWSYATARLWREDSGLVAPGPSSTLEFPFLPCDVYRLVVGGIGHDYSEAPAFRVFADDETPQPLDLPLPTVIDLAAAIDDPPDELRLVYVHDAVYSRARTPEQPGRMMLPPGKYLIVDGPELQPLDVRLGPND